MLIIMKKLKKVAKKVVKLATAPGFGRTTYWPV